MGWGGVGMVTFLVLAHMFETTVLRLLRLSTKHGCSPKGTCAQRAKPREGGRFLSKILVFGSWMLLLRTMIEQN